MSTSQPDGPPRGRTRGRPRRPEQREHLHIVLPKSIKKLVQSDAAMLNIPVGDRVAEVLTLHYAAGGDARSA